MEFFGKPNHWAATIILILAFGMGVFIIACLAGMFVDPSMAQATRAAIVGAWGVVSGIIALALCIARHG